jgi:hypothetical protein
VTADRWDRTRFGLRSLPSRVALVIPLLAASAAAGAIEDSDAAMIRSCLFDGDAGLAIDATDKSSAPLLANTPDLVLSICRFASDSAFRLRPGIHESTPDQLADRLERLAASARSSAAARWAKAEVQVLRARLALRSGNGKPEDLLAAATEVVRATAGTNLADNGLLRAVDLHLEVAAGKEARAKALEGLASLAEIAEGDASMSKATRAAARAAVLLEGNGDAGTKVEEGLKLLTPFASKEAPDPGVVRRYNDFVTLGRTLGQKTEYRLVLLDADSGRVKLQAPLSRCWRVLEPDSRKMTVGFFLFRPDGTPRFQIETSAYVPGEKYPPDAAKQADGRQTRKLAEAFLAADKDHLFAHDTKGIRRAKLGPNAKEACCYEILGRQGGSSTRIRAWFFRGDTWSYGLRIVEKAPRPDEDDPELDAMLATVDGT